MIRAIAAFVGIIVIGSVVFYAGTVWQNNKTKMNLPPAINNIRALKPTITKQLTKQATEYTDFELRGSGMEPSFSDRSHCKLDNKAYISASPQMGDVVLYTVSTKENPSLQLVKRIIGLPREQFMINKGNVYINNALLSEPYLVQSNTTFLSSTSYFKESTPYTIPTNSYILLGDNRLHTLDSRETGFVDRSKITGKIISCSK